MAWALPLARKAAATVRRPCASSVPVNNVISFLHVGAVNNGRKTVRTSIMGSGRGMNILLDEIVRWSASILPQKALMPGSFPKLYKVKLTPYSKCPLHALQTNEEELLPLVCSQAGAMEENELSALQHWL